MTALQGETSMTAIRTKNAIVTGAAQGIGLATAKLLAEAGRRVGCLDVNGPEAGRAAIKRIHDELARSLQVRAGIQGHPDWSVAVHKYTIH